MQISAVFHLSPPHTSSQMKNILTHRSLERDRYWNRPVTYPTCWSVCVSVQKGYCGKMADRIWIPFGVVSGVSRGRGVLDGVVIVKGKGQFWELMWDVPLSPMGLLRSCARVTHSSQITLGGLPKINKMSASTTELPAIHA